MMEVGDMKRWELVKVKVRNLDWERGEEREKEGYQPRAVGASNHVEAGLALFGVGHTERQAGQLH